ncbi:hypothetical protein GPA22_21030 [Aromatoleum toluvorans]|uniref:SPW repeat-containing integral membrane domain-containing protein n=1 Tax=Aromatoleum toluvorans TaxID=92002 RepID=A0ABX1Q4C1_9RHOO|nr:SPW repeat protein [Aromatoleum toluvorans]NMG46208.1 hypothetical protein [Aromatoleum toluvorans]
MSATVKHWQDPVNLILGVWLGVSPWAFSYAMEAAPTWNAVMAGALIAALALFELIKVAAWEEWASVAIGAWLVASPWILGFAGVTAAMGNAVLVGLVVAVLALWALGTDKSIGGWWTPAT